MKRNLPGKVLKLSGRSPYNHSGELILDTMWKAIYTSSYFYYKIGDKRTDIDGHFNHSFVP